MIRWFLKQQITLSGTIWRLVFVSEEVMCCKPLGGIKMTQQQMTEHEINGWSFGQDGNLVSPTLKWLECLLFCPSLLYKFLGERKGRRPVSYNLRPSGPLAVHEGEMSWWKTQGKLSMVDVVWFWYKRSALDSTYM